MTEGLMMATEAQRLIGISLAKIAQSRCGRGGVSLHKNLLVATVLQKARFIFMEEAYHMVHGHYLQATKQFLTPSTSSAPPPQQPAQPLEETDDDDLDEIFSAPTSSLSSDDEAGADDKENSPPEATDLTYFDLDVNRIQRSPSSGESGTKRRREVTEWETEEAVLSILPKRHKSVDSDAESLFGSDDESGGFLSDAALLADNVSREQQQHQRSQDDEEEEDEETKPPAMEGIERITSLVSIFSFGNLTRSVSTPDLCSSQATKDPEGSSLQQQQRTFLAMTV